MSKQVFLIEGDSLPPKLAVVAEGLEPAYLLEIENRFLPSPGYSRIRPVIMGRIKLESEIHGKHDQSYFSGRDTARLETEGGTGRVSSDSKPGRIVEEEKEYGGRVAFLVKRTTNGITENSIVVYDADVISASFLVETIGRLPGKASLDVQQIGVGTFRVAPEIVVQGMVVMLAPQMEVAKS